MSRSEIIKIVGKYSFRVLIKLLFQTYQTFTFLLTNHFFHLHIRSEITADYCYSSQISFFHSNFFGFFFLFQASGELVALRKENASHSRSNRTTGFLRCRGYDLEFRKNCRRRSQNIEVILSFLFPQFRMNNVLRILNV